MVRIPATPIGEIFARYLSPMEGSKYAVSPTIIFQTTVRSLLQIQLSSGG